MKKKRLILICLGIVSFLLLHACGYRLYGGGDLPGGIKTIYVEVLENNTSESSIETIFTNDIISEFIRFRKVTLTSRETAQGILTGTIRSMRLNTLSRKSANSVSERLVTITVDLVLKDQEGRLLWLGKGITEYEAYDVLSDKQSTEQNRRIAIEDLSNRLSEVIYHRLTSGF